MALSESNDVAIIGMACIFPGAGDLATFWRNIQAGHDAISQLSPERWGRAFLDAGSQGVDRIDCTRGGFIDEFATFDAVKDPLKMKK